MLDLIQGKTTISQASRTYGLPPTEVENWVDEGKRGMENALRLNPLDMREHYERQLKQPAAGLRRSHAGVACQQKIVVAS